MTVGNKLLIRNMRVDMMIGVYEFEKQKAQPVIINLEAAVTLQDNPDDNIDNVVSYEDIVKNIRALAATGHIHLVETFAERIAETCLLDKRVLSVMVRIEKPEIFENVDGVGIEIFRAQ